ncbi:MAG: hypothetical protein ACJ703_07725 [Nitrososphaera sp.]
MIYLPRQGFEPGSAPRKGVDSPYPRLQTPGIPPLSSSTSMMTTTPMNWTKYKEYLYADLRPNTA